MSFYSGAVITAQANRAFLHKAVNANTHAKTHAKTNADTAEDTSGWAAIAPNDSPLALGFAITRILPPSLLDGANTSDKDLLAEIEDAVLPGAMPPVLLVDMDWLLDAPVGGRTIETWGQVAHHLAEAHKIKIISVYDQEKLIEDDLAAALRAHRHFLAPSGLYLNPYWLPGDLARQGTTDDQMRYYLGQIAPDYASGSTLDSHMPSLARGGAPDWIAPAASSLSSSAQNTRWHIHCLGELSVYTGDSVPVDWRVSGGSPMKTKLLFAYLLTRGTRPTHADQIAEVVWPDNRSEEDKRKRLHHTISSLRKVLGGKDTIHRSGAHYTLNVPPGSWIDMNRFEQLCRRGLALMTHDSLDAAYKVYAAAERLYRGDLFESLPLESLDYELEDWCMSRRRWLNSMAAKLNYDMSKVLRRTGRLNEALLHCQKSLAFDPTDDNGNLEMVRVLLEQGRLDAVARHVKQFERVSESNGISMRASNFFKEYQAIIAQ